MRISNVRLIVMFDEGNTRRLSLNAYWIWLMVFVLMFVPLLLVLSIWFNIHLFGERGGLMVENIQLQRAVNEGSQTIARLENLGTFLRSHASQGTGQKKAGTDQKKSPTLIQGSSVKAYEVAKINEGYVRVEKLEATYNDAKLSVRFQLMNTGKQTPLFGEQQYGIIASNGKQEKRFPVRGSTNMHFRINSWKQVVSDATVSIPMDYARNLRLEVSVVNAGEIIFNDVYPIK